METSGKSGKRQAIIKAAIKIFSQKGFHDARMEEIAAAAGIGKGTIYEYFSGKTHLFQEIMEASISAYYESLELADIESLTVKERFQILLTGHLRFCIENKELTKIVFWDMEVMDVGLKEWGNNMRKEKQLRLEELINQGINKGEIRRLDTQLLALLIQGFFASLWAPITIDGRAIDPEAESKKIIDIMFNGIAP